MTATITAVNFPNLDTVILGGFLTVRAVYFL